MDLLIDIILAEPGLEFFFITYLNGKLTEFEVTYRPMRPGV